jgi:hypothetical protein
MEHDRSYSIVLWFSFTVKDFNVQYTLCGRFLMIDACTVERDFIRQALREAVDRV